MGFFHQTVGLWKTVRISGLIILMDMTLKTGGIVLAREELSLLKQTNIFWYFIHIW
jgi:hypothetical protein